MKLLTILFGLMMSNQLPKDNVTVDFEFKSMGLGKPTLAFYHYQVTLTNQTTKPVYIVLPRWFADEPNISGTVSGAQYDSFDKIKGCTLFSETTFTVFSLKAKGKIVLSDYDIETFDESIQKKLTTGLRYIICSKITVGQYSLPEFMEKQEEFGNNLIYKLEDAVVKDITIKTSK
jgi:hypothetical protein